MAQPDAVATLESSRDEGRPPDEVALDLAVLASLLALGVALTSLFAGPLAWDREAAVAGVAGQLGETLPAAVLVLVAVAANLGAGAVLARLAAGAPFDGPARAVLAATVGAVLLDTALLFTLGTVGLFRAPILIGVHVAILAVGWLASRSRPLLAAGVFVPGPAGLAWAIVVVAWLGAFVLQLASPVVPFLDVLPNHVAPVERLRTFGEFAVLTESPAPIYGPSRSFLGYIAWLGTIATMTGLPAALAVSAFILPSSLLVAVGVHRLATAIAGPGAGLWGLIAFTLTASFARLTDARATVVVLPVVLGALAFLADRLVDAPERPEGAAPKRPARVAAPRARAREGLLLGAALGAGVLVHPVVGFLAVATVAIVVLLRPGIADVGVPAVAVASALAVPQAATMVGFALPSAVGLVAVVPAVLLGLLFAAPKVGLVVAILGRAALLAAVPLALAWSDLLVRGGLDGLDELVQAMPLLTIGAIAGFALAPRVAGHPIVLGGLAAGVAVGALTQLVPEGEGLLDDSIRFELPKTLHYWLPVFASLATAIGVLAVWRHDRLTLPLRAGLVAVFLVVAVVPMRSDEIDDHHLGEHRLAETLAIDLRFAGRGYWAAYPDARRVVDGPRVELLQVLRDELAAGRIDGRTNLLHVAPTFQQWSATPFGVFVGIRETVVSQDAEESIHTVGGRLRPVDRLDELLASGTYAYVALEPGDGVPTDSRERILAAGYETRFANGHGEIFRVR